MRVLVFIVDYDEGCINPINFVVPGQPDAEVEVGRIGRDKIIEGSEIGS